MDAGGGALNDEAAFQKLDQFERLAWFSDGLSPNLQLSKEKQNRCSERLDELSASNKKLSELSIYCKDQSEKLKDAHGGEQARTSFATLFGLDVEEQVSVPQT